MFVLYGFLGNWKIPVGSVRFRIDVGGYGITDFNRGSLGTIG